MFSQSFFITLSKHGTSVIRQKGVCVLGGKKYSFYRKFGVLCFLKIPVLRVALLLYY